MKKRDRDFTSLSFGGSRSGDSHRSSGGAGGGSPFSLSRFLPSRSRRRHHSKSRMSLDSDSTKSECSLASHNVTSTSLPAFHNNTATTATTATPLNRSQHNHPTVTMATSSSSGVTTTTAAAAASLSSSSQALPFSMSPNISENGTVDGPMRECPVCMMEQTLDCFPPVQTCEHRSCLQCLRHYLQIEISESRINIACPECNEQFHPNDMGAILEDQRLMGKYEDFMLRRVLAMDPDTRWCPAPDCGFAVIATGCAGCPKLKCEREGCNTYFCYHCKQHWHPNQTCDAARAERSPNIRSASVSYSHESNAQNEIKPCPRCGAFIVKMNDGSCNHMTCAVCAAEFCWLCMKEISDLHYLSPSGCTFWGQKPWSRKKKILWQLGTLVGAPLGITLVAGIAVPAMIIAIPVWVGRKIHARYRQSSRHRRNLAITGGVVASILASPIIAGLAVGIGVPILLAYIYGVVPISLCRSGGCGVTTTNTGGVRFEFDEENEGNAQGNFSGDNQSETMPAVANPSIAPSIGDASLGMTNSLSASGSHMDRVGVLRDADSDRDSASNRAIAGASLNGSLCGSSYTNKLEVQADVVPAGGPHKRTSFSSESANISLSEKSATVSFDEASLRVVYSDGHREAETGEHRDADSAVFDSGDSSSAATTGAPSLTSPHSPRPLPRSGASSEEGRHGAKCKKLTRFMDDVQTVTASSSAVVTGDSATVTSGRVGPSRTSDVSPPKGSAFPTSGSGSKVSTSVVFAGSSGAGSRSTTPTSTSSASKVTSMSSGGKGSKGSANTKSSTSTGTDRNANRAKRPHSLSGKHSNREAHRSRHASSVAAVPAATTFHETDFPSSASPTSDISSSSSDRVVAATLVPSEMAAISRVCNGEATSSGVPVLPEVDTDKPVSSRRSSLVTVNTGRPSSASDATAGQSLGGRARSLSLSCSSLDRRLSSMGDVSSVSVGDGGAAAAVVAAARGADSEDSATSHESCSLRRYSYELAYCHGRISPSLFDEPH